MLAARKKKFQSARPMSRPRASASEFLIISQPCEYSSVSTSKDWGMIVPAFIMVVPASIGPDNRVSPSVEDPAANEKLMYLTRRVRLRLRAALFPRRPDGKVSWRSFVSLFVDLPLWNPFVCCGDKALHNQCPIECLSDESSSDKKRSDARACARLYRDGHSTL